MRRETPDTLPAIDAVGELGVALDRLLGREGGGAPVMRLYHRARVTVALADVDRRTAQSYLNNGYPSGRAVEERERLMRELDYWSGLVAHADAP